MILPGAPRKHFEVILVGAQNQDGGYAHHFGDQIKKPLPFLLRRRVEPDVLADFIMCAHWPLLGLLTAARFLAALWIKGTGFRSLMKIFMCNTSY
jgi:hypothetical protein